MNVAHENHGLAWAIGCRRAAVFLGSLSVLCLGWAARAQTGPDQITTIPQVIPVEQGGYMSEALRSSVKKAVVVAGESPPSDEIGGTYQKETAGLIGGMNEGSRIGTVSH